MKKKSYSMFGRTVAFLLLLFSLVCLPVGVVGTYYMASEGFYLVNVNKKSEYLDEYFRELGKILLYECHEKGEETATKRLEGFCIYYQVTTPDGEVMGNYTEDIGKEWSQVYIYEPGEGIGYGFQGIENYSIEMIAPKVKEYPDYVAFICFVTNNHTLLKVLLPVMAGCGLVLAISSFVYLMCAAGWNRREERQTSGAFGMIPTDIFTIAAVTLVVGIGWTCEIKYGTVMEVIQTFLMILLLTLLVVGYLMSMAARAKAGTIWTHSLLGWLWKGIATFFQMIKEVVAKLPLIWKLACLLGATTVIEWLFHAKMLHELRLYQSMINVVILWGVEKVLLIPIVLFMAIRIKDLQVAAKRLAEGDIQYKVDTTLMFGNIKEHGENLNRISEGVTKAVGERMKSEHLKTELITNVSHDIKTPLTSIINYSDLICKEETDNEKIKEYADVLYRQSSRLKKLIEDLVDASKASTGNIEVNLQPCEVGVLLEQATGEFEQRLFEKNIDLVSKQPEHPVQIMADPKLLWRVFDNLMNNICKYGQNGTRVYLSVEEQEGRAVICFKNISAYPLDMDADELMERFVRGDRSRHTEGNGLGLNIAQSLTELQNGTLKLVIDGDLFKVLLSFPINSDQATRSQKALIASE